MQEARRVNAAESASSWYSPGAIKLVRWGLLIGAAILLVFTAGLLTRAGWATDLWPWPDAKMSYNIGAAITATIAAAFLWIGWTRDLAALEPFACELSLAMPGFALYLGWMAVDRNDTALGGMALGYLIATIGGVAAWWWSRGLPLQERGPLPRLVKWAFRLFVMVLTPVGIALVLQVENVLPGDTLPETSTLIGFVFLGAAILFEWILLHPEWSYGIPALLGFLAYDLVLIMPYLRVARDAGNDVSTASYYSTPAGGTGSVNELSLAIYLGVLIFSATVAIYTLFLDRRTRIISG